MTGKHNGPPKGGPLRSGIKVSPARQVDFVELAFGDVTYAALGSGMGPWPMPRSRFGCSSTLPS